MTLSALVLSTLTMTSLPAINIDTRQIKGSGGIIILPPKKENLQGSGGIIILPPKKEN